MKVYNRRTSANNATYIGRPSKWGNPFVIGRDGSREEVIAKYEEYARNRFTIEDLAELAGKDLLCWCAPLPCHGDVLIKLIKEEVDRINAKFDDLNWWPEDDWTPGSY
jgi:hypothetical protein